MSIEICDDTRTAICVTVVCTAIVALAFMVYRYNALAYENGYTQKQLENSQMTVWVKP